MDIQAAILWEQKQPLSVEAAVLDAPGPGEVLVEVKAAGVCHSDLHPARGDWPAKTPLVLGHEGAGIVRAIGPAVTQVSAGDHVVLCWAPACGECPPCREGRAVLCDRLDKTTYRNRLPSGGSRLHARQQDVAAFLGTACFSNYVVVPQEAAIPVARDLPFDALATLGCAVLTGVGAVTNAAKVPAGARVAVIGAGGVGLNVVQGAKLAGAERIIAIDVLPDKTALAVQFGATDRIDAARGDAVELLFELLPDGVDYAFDAIGHTSTTEQAIRMLGLGGAAVVVGLPKTGARASFEPLVLAEADQRILGSNYGSVRPSIDIPALVDRYMDGQLKLDPLIWARRPLAEAADAFTNLESGEALRTLLIP
jgi:S-(hydroxymethyl)glutathione dehydrogenase / alcohol dehydrogenase